MRLESTSERRGLSVRRELRAREAPGIPLVGHGADRPVVGPAAHRVPYVTARPPARAGGRAVDELS